MTPDKFKPNINLLHSQDRDREEMDQTGLAFQATTDWWMEKPRDNYK